VRRVAAPQQVAKVRPPLQRRHLQRAVHLPQRLQVLVRGRAQVARREQRVAFRLRLV